jgi:hypothetical protein
MSSTINNTDTFAALRELADKLHGSESVDKVLADLYRAKFDRTVDAAAARGYALQWFKSALASIDQYATETQKLVGSLQQYVMQLQASVAMSPIAGVTEEQPKSAFRRVLVSPYVPPVVVAQVVEERKSVDASALVARAAATAKAAVLPDANTMMATDALMQLVVSPPPSSPLVEEARARARFLAQDGRKQYKLLSRHGEDSIPLCLIALAEVLPHVMHEREFARTVCKVARTTKLGPVMMCLQGMLRRKRLSAMQRDDGLYIQPLSGSGDGRVVSLVQLTLATTETAVVPEATDDDDPEATDDDEPAAKRQKIERV